MSLLFSCYSCTIFLVSQVTNQQAFVQFFWLQRAHSEDYCTHACELRSTRCPPYTSIFNLTHILFCRAHHLDVDAAPRTVCRAAGSTARVIEHGFVRELLTRDHSLTVYLLSLESMTSSLLASDECPCYIFWKGLEGSRADCRAKKAGCVASIRYSSFKDASSRIYNRTKTWWGKRQLDDRLFLYCIKEGRAKPNGRLQMYAKGNWMSLDTGRINEYSWEWFYFTQIFRWLRALWWSCRKAWMNRAMERYCCSGTHKWSIIGSQKHWLLYGWERCCARENRASVDGNGPYYLEVDSDRRQVKINHTEAQHLVAILQMVLNIHTVEECIRQKLLLCI